MRVVKTTLAVAVLAMIGAGIWFHWPSCVPVTLYKDDPRNMRCLMPSPDCEPEREMWVCGFTTPWVGNNPFSKD